jgi:ABC-type branched-subunit amino acid transport system substrate-binding protein
MSVARGGRRRWVVVAVVACLALVAAACGSDDDSSSPTTAGDGGEKPVINGVPGVTDSEIQFAGLGTVKSPTGDCYYSCFIAGAKAYFAYRNSEGGIFGRDLVVSKEYDDELGKHQQLALEIVSADDVLGVLNASIVYAGLPEFTKAGYPVYSYLSDPPQAKAENVFGSPMPSCVECPHIEDVYAAKVVGATKIAAIGYGVAPSSGVCADAVKTAFDRWGSEANGAEVVYVNKGLAYGFPNGVAPEATQMKNLGVDLLFACIDANGAKTMINELHRQGSDAALFQVSSLNNTTIEQNKEAYEGAVVASSTRPAPPLASVNGTDRQLMLDWLEKSGNPEVTEEIALHGWVVARLAYEGLKKAGAEGLSRQALIDATNSIEDYTAGGIVPPWDVGRQHDIPDLEDGVKMGWEPYCFSLVQIKDGKQSLMKPATKDKPLLCWPGDNLDWSEPEATTFE